MWKSRFPIIVGSCSHKQLHLHLSMSGQNVYVKISQDLKSMFTLVTFNRMWKSRFPISVGSRVKNYVHIGYISNSSNSIIIVNIVMRK